MIVVEFGIASKASKQVEAVIRRPWRVRARASKNYVVFEDDKESSFSVSRLAGCSSSARGEEKRGEIRDML